MSADYVDPLLANPGYRERRRRHRAHVHWQVEFHRQDLQGSAATETQNLSSDGFYCRSKAVFAPGELIDCTLQIPSHRPQSNGAVVPVNCRVRVVRVDAADSEGFHGIGCRIEDYHLALEAMRVG